MSQVVITEFMHPPSAAVLESEFDVLYDPDLATDRARLIANIPDCLALVVRNQTRVDSELLDKAPSLSVVARLGVGLDNIDLDKCRERGIEVAPTTGANAIAVAEYVMGALLTLARGVFDQSSRVIDGEWPRNDLRGGELAGKRLGLIGFGVIARAVAARAAAMEMDVVSHDPYLDPDDPVWGTVSPIGLDDLLASSDAISVHVPLVEGTRHLIDEAAVSAVRDDALVINTSRGGVVDESAVIAALRDGRLGGAALDVFEREPLDASTGAVFAGVPNLIVTPHIAGITRESDVRIGEMTVASVRRHLSTGQ